VTAGRPPPPPTNEPNLSYGPGSPERASLEARLEELAATTIEAPCVIDGRDVMTGNTFEARAPHDHDLHLANVHAAGRQEVDQAIDAALAAKHDWAAMDWLDRAAIFLRAADLASGPWRDTLNGATMLHQSKTISRPRSTLPAN
jgi:1-pyrroline-5-carboxylate dehydrogenase